MAGTPDDCPPGGPNGSAGDLVSGWNRLRRTAWNCLCYPWRIFCRKISLQLIASHVLIVLLSLFVTYVVVFGALYDLVPKEILGQSAFLDYSIGERSRAVAFHLDPADVALVAAGGDGRSLDAALSGLLVSPQASGRPRPAASVLTSIANIAIVAPDGRVLASTSSDWATPGQQISAGSDLVAGVTMQALALQGNVAPGLDDFSYGIDSEGTVTAASHPIIGDAGQVVGFVTVQSVPSDIRDAGPFWDVVKYVYQTQRRTLLIIILASLAIAVPLGTWRARSVSGRLKRLARAADAVAHGELERRVVVGGPMRLPGWRSDSTI